MTQGDWNPQTRAASISQLLLTGKRMTTAEIAEHLGMSYHGARRLMVNLSLVLPITKIDGRWQRVSANVTAR